jgi:hypothetical protein
MITIKSLGDYEDSGDLLNYHIQRGQNRINLDTSNGPFYIASDVELTDNTWLTSNYAFPNVYGAGDVRQYSSTERALLRRHPGRARMLITNGSNVKVTNLTFDYNMRNSWEWFIRPISHATTSGMTPRPLSKVLYEDLDFVDYFHGFRIRSEAPNTNLDSWSIVFTHNRSEPATDFVVRRCANKSPGMQLTSGGAGVGYNRVLIEDCYCVRGAANSIALTMKYGSDPDSVADGASTLQNVTIRRNRIYEMTSIGIFVGQDGNDEGKVVNLKNILIEDNDIDMRREGQFNSCVRIKIGSDSASTCENLVIRNNRFDVNRNLAFDSGNRPRWINASAAEGNTVSEILHYGNQNIGNIGAGGQNTIANFVTNLTSPPSSPEPKPELPVI